MNLEKKAKEFKEKVFENMAESRGAKYQSFLKLLKSFRYLTISHTRGEFLESYYALMRYIDDVVDGDIEMPPTYNKTDFVKSKIDFSSNPLNPKDDVDNLILYCYDLGERFGADFKQETHDILSSMLFDAQRYGKKKVFSEQELSHHFNLLDIRGTASATLKVFKESPDKCLLLYPLALSNRTFMNLRDFEEDLQVGFINISHEDIEKHKINPETLTDRSSQNVPAWFIDQAVTGLELSKEHRMNLSKNNFNLLTKLAMPLAYENPSREYFQKVLERQI